MTLRWQLLAVLRINDAFILRVKKSKNKQTASPVKMMAKCLLKTSREKKKTPTDIASHPRRPKSSAILLWKPQISSSVLPVGYIFTKTCNNHKNKVSEQ
jgi:hypothetical protein